MKKTIATLTALLMLACSQAQIKLPRLVRDSMILQRDTKVKIWGWASANEKITVKISNQKIITKADDAGNWSVLLKPVKAGGPYTMDITGKNKISLKEILFGDVWFCSGQSNMVHQLNIHDVTYAAEIANANYPQIRQFWIPTLTNLQEPQQDLPAGNWKAAVGEDVRPFSAVAYFFAKNIFEKYKVPVGIINASVGGTPIEAWTAEDGFNGFPSIESVIQRNKDTAFINRMNKRTASAKPAEPTDKGLTGSVKWYDPAVSTKGWRTINIPGYWEDQGIKDLNGVVWYRKQIMVPASMADKADTLFMGRIVDADEVYINGKPAGNTTYQYPQRRYKLQAGALKTGLNTIVIRVTNYGGKGGFVPDKPYCLFAGNDTIDLKGTWLYKVGDVFTPSVGTGGGGISFQNQPTALYNAMVAPAIPYTIKGICWYQGESNTGKPDEYAQLLPALIHNWRSKWKNDSLPFLYVQLPGFMDYNYLPTESNWAIHREAVRNTLTVPNTAMVVAIDLGEWNDVHPDNKKAVGDRLALAAYNKAYGETIVYSGPQPNGLTRDGNKLVIQFSHTGSGLVSNDNEPLSEFAIAGADKKFVWAKAIIKGNDVIVWNDQVTNPVYVRYAWADNPVNPNLYNKEGLPASPFQLSLK